MTNIISRAVIFSFQEPDVSKLEAKINCGQIEEVILQASRELNLAQNMLVWQPWEPLISEAPRNQWKWPIVWYDYRLFVVNLTFLNNV